MQKNIFKIKFLTILTFQSAINAWNLFLQITKVKLLSVIVLFKKEVLNLKYTQIQIYTTRDY